MTARVARHGHRQSRSRPDHARPSAGASLARDQGAPLRPPAGAPGHSVAWVTIVPSCPNTSMSPAPLVATARIRTLGSSPNSTQSVNPPPALVCQAWYTPVPSYVVAKQVDPAVQVPHWMQAPVRGEPRPRGDLGPGGPVAAGGALHRPVDAVVTAHIGRVHLDLPARIDHRVRRAGHTGRWLAGQRHPPGPGAAGRDLPGVVDELEGGALALGERVRWTSVQVGRPARIAVPFCGLGKACGRRPFRRQLARNTSGEMPDARGCPRHGDPGVQREARRVLVRPLHARWPHGRGAGSESGDQ